MRIATPPLRLAIAARRFEEAPEAEAVAGAIQRLGLRALLAEEGVPAGSAAREVLAAAGISVVGLRAAQAVATLEDFPQRLEKAASRASRLRAPWLLVEGGRIEEASAASEPSELRLGFRERWAERAVRALHAGLATGAPLAIRPAGGADGLLGFEETGWLLDDLPRLGLWQDPHRALSLGAHGLGPPPEAWAERWAGRTAGLLVGGTGAAHPEAAGLDWSTLRDTLPRRIPWVLDLGSDLPEAAVADAAAFVAALLS